MCHTANVRPKLHLRFCERVAHGTENYAPGNLPSDQSIMITSSRHHSSELLELRARNLNRFFVRFRIPSRSLPDVKNAIFAATVSYFIYIAIWTFILISLVWIVLGTLGVVEPLMSIVRVTMIALGGFGLAYVMQVFAERRMTTLFSRFWHDVQLQLRDALKDARRAVRRGGAPNCPASYLTNLSVQITGSWKCCDIGAHRDFIVHVPATLDNLSCVTPSQVG